MSSVMRAVPMTETGLKGAIRLCRPHFVSVAVFSALINILNLTPTIYMMQVYDRVLGTGSIPTLVALSIACLVGIAILSALDWLRSRLLVRATSRFDTILAPVVMRALLSRPGLSRLERSEGMRQFDTLRQAIGGPGALAAFDIPWTPIYIIVAFMLHPALGAMALVACLVMLVLAWGNERATHSRLTTVNTAAAAAYGDHSYTSAHAAEVRAMGMRDALITRQLRDRAQVNGLQMQVGFAAVGHSGFIRFVRLALQSMALGLGGFLAVRGSITPGAVIATTFLFSRSLAPIEQIVGAWKGLAAARDAYRGIDALISGHVIPSYTRLPDPSGRIAIEHLTVLTPQNERVALANISFDVEAGAHIGVVGLSGSGKSTLLRALAGALEPMRGFVRYDGAAYPDWDPDQITASIGYLPQEFVLFPGTVKENISRFASMQAADGKTIDALVIEAAQKIGVHDMIVRLPQGYETRIGTGGVGLSAGQTQRVAIARALYGEPKILILDEPNAHLDAEAEYQLTKLLGELKRKGVTVVLAAHSGDVLASVDKLLLLQDGAIARFGPLSTQQSVPSRHPTEKA